MQTAPTSYGLPEVSEFPPTPRIQRTHFARQEHDPACATWERSGKTVGACDCGFWTETVHQPRALTIGIDPGLSGAIAMLDERGDVVFVDDLPVVRDNKLAWIDGGELQSLIINWRSGRQCTAMIERVNAMPQQGVSSSFQFGVGFGSILGVLQAMSIPIEFVRPTNWKKAMALSSDKKAALHKARLLYPDVDLHLAKHDGRAEALLIARYARSRNS